MILRALRIGSVFFIFVVLSMAHASTKHTPLSVYENSYMLFGLDNSEFTNHYTFKFKLSSKLRILQSPIYLAYTQKSFMDLGSYSLPFYEHNFRPEIFFFQHIADRKWLKDIHLGFVHESNGRADSVDNRSWNYVNAKLYFSHTNGLYFRPNFRVSFSIASENRDIRNYYGFLDWALGWRSKAGVEVSALLRHGQDFKRSNITLNCSIPWRQISKKFPKETVTALWIQAFYGFGESLLGYNQISQSLAVGVGFTE